jgi:competence protein ComEA
VEPSGAPWRVIESPEAPAAPAAVDARPTPWIAIGAVVLAVVVAVVAFLVASRPSEPLIAVDGATTAGGETLTDGAVGEGAAGMSPGGTLVVEVAGAVVRPGVYHLTAGARVGDAIEAAGGFGPRVDLAEADRALNLAATVRDGDEIRVPARGEVVAGASSPGVVGGGAGSLVDLNRATAEALDTLPGVGPATAAKIIAAREEQPFGSVDDLGTRKVVGPATLEKIRELVTAGP